MTHPDPGLLPPDLATDDPPVPEDELQRIGEGGEPENPDRVIETFGHVEWAFRRLAQSRARLDELAEQYAEMVGRIEAWYERECGPERSTVLYLSGLIERYAMARRTYDPEGPATFRFPSGSVTTRRTKERQVVIGDKKELVSWLAEHVPLAAVTCRIELHPRISDLRDRVEMGDDGAVIYKQPNDDGEYDVVTVPGLAVEEPHVDVTSIDLTQEDSDQ